MRAAKFFLSLLLSSSLAWAVDNNCVVVIVGGTMHRSPDKPGWHADQDLASKVQSAAILQARSTGCRVEDLSEISEEQFVARLRRLAPNGQRPRIHLSFTDHGVPSEVPAGQSILPLGENPNGSMHYTRLGTLFQTLSQNLPANSRVTFQSATCWPAFNEAALDAGFDQRMDFCGSSSTHNAAMSRNITILDEDGMRVSSNGNVEGPYPAAGLLHAVVNRRRNREAPTVYQNHVLSRMSDTANILRNPGFTTSLTFARRVVNTRTQSDAMPFRDPYGLAYEVHQLPAMVRGIVELGLRPPSKAGTIARSVVERMLCTTCPPSALSGFEAFLVNITAIREFTVQQPPEWMTGLPAAYAGSALQAFNYFKNNPALIRDFFELTDIGRVPARFLPLASHLRTLQEAATIAKFMSVASAAEKTRFNRIAGCENRPML